MNTGNLTNFLKGRTAHRVPKLATLTVASLVLVALVNIDASASPSTFSRTNSSATTGGVNLASSVAQYGELIGFGRHHNPPSNGGGASGGSVAPTTTTTGVTSGTANVVTTTTVPATTTTEPSTTTTDPATTTTDPSTPFPIGTLDSSEPSGYAPPAANALSGYGQTYVTDFTGSTLPAQWDAYSGQPGGDPGALFAPTHLTVSGGLLDINTFQDSADNNEWVTGGTCLCNAAVQTYGAYFVRSRMTGPGPTGVELLWPTGSWPPEVDFNETYGTTTGTSATLHYSASNLQIQDGLTIDMTQWHTWGVIWTPTSITYTVDGTVWGTVTNTAAIPSGSMYLSLQSQTWCSSNWACPTSPQSMQVDWVAAYSPN